MKLLLLLSALLSALSGTSVGARGMPAPVAVNQIARAVAVSQAAAVQRSARPLAALPSLAANAPAPLAGALALVPFAPLYLSRRRE